MARKFLYVIAALTVLVIIVLFALRIWAEELTEIAFVPDTRFEALPTTETNTYDDPRMWLARPGLGERDLSRWLPPGVESDEPALGAAVFFIHPTSYFERAAWNAPLDNAKSNDVAEVFVRGMASPFNTSIDLWAPRYRQAAFGAFLTDKHDAQQAIDAAYADVLQAFDTFIRTVDPKRPIILAGHSQGAFHLRRLMQERVNGTPLAPRIAAAYLIGWPISLKHDLPQMGLPACTDPEQGGCVMSWLSVAEPADNTQLLKGYARHKGLDGRNLKGSHFLCTNPLTGTQGGTAEASANLGTLVPNFEQKSGALVAGVVPARCGKDDFLYIGPPPDLELGPYVMPGNNYHVFDIALFWANLRKDAKARVAAWQATQ